MYGNAAAKYAENNVSYASATPDRISIVESATKTMTEATSRLANLTDRVRQLADNTFGIAPRALSAQSEASPPPNGRAEALQRSGSDLHGIITELEHELDRLGNL